MALWLIWKRHCALRWWGQRLEWDACNLSPRTYSKYRAKFENFGIRIVGIVILKVKNKYASCDWGQCWFSNLYEQCIKLQAFFIFWKIAWYASFAISIYYSLLILSACICIMIIRSLISTFVFFQLFKLKKLRVMKQFW